MNVFSQIITIMEAILALYKTGKIASHEIEDLLRSERIKRFNQAVDNAVDNKDTSDIEDMFRP